MDNFEDPAADFLAREQNDLAELGEDNFGITNDNNAFENNHVDDEFQDEVIGSGNNDEDDQANNDFYGAIRSQDVERGEPEKVTQWRVEFEKKILEKDAAEQQAITEWEKAALHEMETWHNNHVEQLKKSCAINRDSQKEFIRERDETLPGGEWERVSRLCDFNPKTNKQMKDVSRMRNILLRLKTEPLVR